MPISTNVPIPDASSTNGIAIRRGAITSAIPKPIVAAIISGSFTRMLKKPGIAVGSCDSVRWRPRSSADPLV